MQLEPIQEPGTQDRRVRRSRAALMAAAVRLVSERGTSDIPVTDLAEAADVSRRLVYLQFGDRDTLLTEAAIDLVRRELLPRAGDGGDTAEGVAALTRHFAEHRSFYRPMLTGSCAFAMTGTLNKLFGSLNRPAVSKLFGDLDRQTADDLSEFIAGGAATLVNNWVIDGTDPLDPEELTNRLLRLASTLTSSHRGRSAGGDAR
ncbi:TetR/AcrR family transcriptional regulator [Streptomyces prunicolor]|uniref:TetR/AcrR family transcriptional regulator n=1 Tax=Streptomyces prunicolor TaxID=67348 RepID=A0ABU4F2P5_9ACTN|nr:TetR/AcrR family transcriptional regulator [Streptomyces prunicolor]MDV7214844.1 TetR/AcrR family transcriptional regulator [Streptomyces prunicolor]